MYRAAVKGVKLDIQQEGGKQPLPCSNTQTISLENWFSCQIFKNVNSLVCFLHWTNHQNKALPWNENHTSSHRAPQLWGPGESSPAIAPHPTPQADHNFSRLLSWAWETVSWFWMLTENLYGAMWSLSQGSSKHNSPVPPEWVMTCRIQYKSHSCFCITFESDTCHFCHRSLLVISLGTVWEDSAYESGGPDH